MSFFHPGDTFPWDRPGQQGTRPPVKVSSRTFSEVIEEALIHTFTRPKLEVVLAEELGLTWMRNNCEPDDPDLTKRALVDGYIAGWKVPQLAALARRLDAEIEIHESLLMELRRYIDAYERGSGVDGPTKNLIFAANGPKPELVLRDAVSNSIEIVANAQFCLVYDQPVPAEGLRFSHLISWWREREGLAEEMSDRDVALSLHERLRDSLDGNPAELVVFDAYSSRYRASFDIPALIPQVYLHYDPYDQRTRRASVAGSPLPRQRMDFLLLFSDRQRVVIEVDGKQHYADGATASPARYAEMVAEDRRLRLAGYEVYRFGGYELTQDPSATSKVQAFFEELAARMK